MWSHGQTFLSDFYSCCCFFFASLLRSFLTIIIANTDANANADATVEHVVAVDAVVIVVMIIVRTIIIISSSIITDGGGSVNDRGCCIRKADHGSYEGKDWYSYLRNGKKAPSEKNDTTSNYHCEREESFDLKRAIKKVDRRRLIHSCLLLYGVMRKAKQKSRKISAG